jgi:hypothetical protein
MCGQDQTRKRVLYHARRHVYPTGHFQAPNPRSSVHRPNGPCDCGDCHTGPARITRKNLPLFLSYLGDGMRQPASFRYVFQPIQSNDEYDQPLPALLHTRMCLCVLLDCGMCAGTITLRHWRCRSSPNTQFPKSSLRLSTAMPCVRNSSCKDISVSLMRISSQMWLIFGKSCPPAPMRTCTMVNASDVVAFTTGCVR